MSHRVRLFGAAVVMACAGVVSAHPQILFGEQQAAAIRSKVADVSWASASVKEMKARIDPYLEKLAADPQYLTSRLAMNWDTHYATPVTAKSRLVGGEGRSPVPTPRFAGARNWATEWARPSSIDEFMPHNDQDGKIYLRNNKTGEMAWVEPGLTGRTIEAINSDLMRVAEEAGFLYWHSGDERYAKLAADLLWTYMEGFSHTTPPRISDNDANSAKIIGLTSFEVIHEDIVTPMAIAYDFIHAYLTKNENYDVDLIQKQFKRLIDRVIEGGGREGNWNLNQARIIAYGGLALEENEHYADGKGRGYYVDVILNADLPNQKGIAQALRDGVDEKTAMWPEAAGYGFGVIGDIALIASLTGSDPRGRQVLADPLLSRAMLVQGELLYPNGLSNGLGDTSHRTVNTMALEMLIGSARERDDEATEKQLTALLQQEIAAGRYDRSSLKGLLPVSRFVDELKPSDDAPAASPSFFGEPLNVLMMRSEGADAQHSLGAALYGTAGGHVHTNGLAMELYGAGYILGADAGVGGSYWEPEHGQYYAAPPGHNTVIVKGRSNYPSHGKGARAMTIAALEPASGEKALTDSLRYATASFQYVSPISAEQQRTVALVQLDDQHAFAFDVFRSRATEASGGDEEFHDYLYHNIGDSLEVEGTIGTKLAPVDAFSEGLLPGYQYFKQIRSGRTDGTIQATFTASVRGEKPSIKMWMPAPGDTLFVADAPATRTTRSTAAAHYAAKPTPTLILRRQGSAWDKPFVTVYEPYNAVSDKAVIESVEAMETQGAVACVATGALGTGAFRAVMLQDDDPSGIATAGGVSSQAGFSYVLYRGESPHQLHLRNGCLLAAGELKLESDEPIDASIWRDGDGWRYSASRTLRLTIRGNAYELPPAMKAKVMR